MLKYFVRDAFDELAMGNYPWPSDYIAGSAAQPMPPWPMGRACAALADAGLAGDPPSPGGLFSAVRQARCRRRTMCIRISSGVGIGRLVLMTCDL